MMRKTLPRAQHRPRTPRRGSVLIPVLVVTVVLAGTSLAFVELIVPERAAVVAQVRRTQSEAAARSGFEAALAWADQRFARSRVADTQGDAWNPSPLQTTEASEEASVVSWLAPDVDDDGRPKVRRGLVDECGRLNLNALPLEKHEARVARQSLLQIGGMTPHLADALLDWMDSDDEPREFGAETSYYSALPAAYRPANGPFRNLEELLIVRGVTRSLVFGAGRDAGSTAPAIGPGSIPPWSAVLTVQSLESNVRPDGRPKTLLNDDNLPRLYDALERELGDDAARFIVAFRLAGPIDGGEALRARELRGGKEDDPTTMDAREARRKRAQDRSQRQSESEVVDSNTLSDASSMRGGLNLKYRPAYRINSLFDLVGAKVHILIQNQDKVLESPWNGESTRIVDQVEQLSARLATEDELARPGRINPLAAPRPVLRSIPGISNDLIERIISARHRPARNTQIGRPNVAWLVEEGVLNVAQLRKLAPHFATRGGDVFRTRSMGSFGEDRCRVGFEVLIDGTRPRALILSERPLQLEEMMFDTALVRPR
jgi:hypothetical protein